MQVVLGSGMFTNFYKIVKKKIHFSKALKSESGTFNSLNLLSLIRKHLYLQYIKNLSLDMKFSIGFTLLHVYYWIKTTYKQVKQNFTEL